MKHADTHARGRLRQALVLAATIPILIASGLVNDPYNPRFKGGPDAGGGLPKPAGPTSPANPSGLLYSDIAAPTPGLVLDAITRQPISGVAVVVTDPLGQVVAIDVTDASGEFMVYLFDEPDLELAIPTEGIVGVDVQAGEPLLILVP
jgi:hypothetical protein